MKSISGGEDHFVEARLSAHLATETLPQFLASRRAKLGQPFRLWCTASQGGDAAQSLALLLQTALHGKAPFRVLASGFPGEGPGAPAPSRGTFNAIFCPSLLGSMDPSLREPALASLCSRLLPGGHLYASVPQGLDCGGHGLKPVGAGVYHKSAERHLPIPSEANL